MGSRKRACASLLALAALFALVMVMGTASTATAGQQQGKDRQATASRVTKGSRPSRTNVSRVQAAARRATVSELRAKRKVIAAHRSRAWYWQDNAHVPRTPTNYSERHTRSFAYLGWLNRFWVRQQHAAFRNAHAHGGSVPHVICSVFHGQTVRVGTPRSGYSYVAASCDEALHIAWGESRYTTTAVNVYGYAGLFQLGTDERGTYGLHRRIHGKIILIYETAYEQTIAAFNLFHARGWEPWTCCGE